MKSLIVAAIVLVAASGASPSVSSGFSMSRIATVDRARELALTPSGDLLVGTGGSDVYIIPRADGAGAAGTPHVYAHFDDSPAAGVVFASSGIYVGTQFGVWRIPYKTGDQRARSLQKLTSVRTSGVARDHVTTSVAFTNGTLYASVGSSCDACQPDLDRTRATIGRVNNGKYEIVADHIRNAIALTVNENTGSLWAGDAGQDYLPGGHPYEFFDDVFAHPQPLDYGWPNCYENHKRAPDAQNRDCSKVAVPRVVLPAYATPIGAVFYPQHPGGHYRFPPRYYGGAFVTLHGSWHGPPFVAPRVVFIPMHGDSPAIGVDWNNPDKQWSEFVGRYQEGNSDNRAGRPTGIAVGPQGDLFVADDETGAIYRIRPR